jgi:hypothetical protein
MNGIRVDSKLLEHAESNYVEIIDSLDDQAQVYADQFHSQVIVPFCNRHNLRFWSGNGIWFFEAPGGKNFDDPEQLILDWATLTGHAEYKDDCRSVCGKSWQLTCGEDEYPEFFYIFSEIQRLLEKEFMGGHLGYWVNDFVPATFPRQPNGAT